MNKIFVRIFLAILATTAILTTILSVEISANNPEITKFDFDIASLEQLPQIELDIPKKYDFSVELPPQEINSNNPINLKATKTPEVEIAYTAKNTIKIPAIGVNWEYKKSSILDIQSLDQALLSNPIVEKSIATELCSLAGNSYMYGHSEPAYGWQKNYPAVNVFANLHKLKAGDRIYITNEVGNDCVYEVTHWDKLVTDQNNKVSSKEANWAYNPGYQYPSLTIQTCELGSATVRLLLRTKKVA